MELILIKRKDKSTWKSLFIKYETLNSIPADKDLWRLRPTHQLMISESLVYVIPPLSVSLLVLRYRFWLFVHMIIWNF